MLWTKVAFRRIVRVNPEYPVRVQGFSPAGLSRHSADRLRAGWQAAWVGPQPGVIHTSLLSTTALLMWTLPRDLTILYINLSSNTCMVI